jgi:hypothetical protein
MKVVFAPPILLKLAMRDDVGVGRKERILMGSV